MGNDESRPDKGGESKPESVQNKNELEKKVVTKSDNTKQSDSKLKSLTLTHKLTVNDFELLTVVGKGRNLGNVSFLKI